MVVGGRVARVYAESTYYYSTHLVAARVDGVVLLLLLYAAPAPATAATATTATCCCYCYCHLVAARVCGVVL